MRSGIGSAAGWLAISAAIVLGGCTSGSGDDPLRTLPAAGADFDYQLGGDYEPPAGVDVLARDSTSAPAPGVYNICYVNGFQTQPGESESWLAENPDLVLHDASGSPVADPGWPDEFLLDTSSSPNRAGIVDRIAPVLAACDEKGFDAVEIDNLDSWTRSGGALTIDDNIALAESFAEVAHSLGLAIAQKNGAGSSQRFHDDVGFDFVVAEECMRYEECAEYLDVYDGLVFDIEYPDEDSDTAPFEAACGDPARPASMILRDLDLRAADEPGYLRETC